MKVLISGAGVAGCTAAYWLRRFGFDPVVVERSPPRRGRLQDRRQGAALEVRRMGLYDAVEAAGATCRAPSSSTVTATRSAG